MNWWRAHHGLPFDPKFATIARKAQVSRMTVVAAWVAVLDFASQANPRGSVVGIDIEVFSAGFDEEIETIERILAGFREKGMIDESESVTAWAKRQPKREDPTSADRQRKHREQTRDVTRSENNDSQPSHSPRRDVTSDARDAPFPPHTPPFREQNRAYEKDRASRNGSVTSRPLESETRGDHDPANSDGFGNFAPMGKPEVFLP